MTDIEEIIDYIKSLKKGFDKDLFQSKIDELAYVVDTTGLDYEDFHTLFKIWLNLSIPITRWVSLGVCIVPKERVEERTVDYGFRWLLANYENIGSHARMAYLLDWFTAAMDSGCIDMEALDSGYEIFYSMLSIEALAAHAVKLIYTLTKPGDITRGRVLNLLDSAKKKEARKDLLHIHVLLGLFKSYKPECVPEDVPAISIHTSFKKINPTLLMRFGKSQELRNSASFETPHLCWINPLSCEGGRQRKAEPLVPNMEFANIGSKQYSEKGLQKSILDFSDPVKLLQYSLWHSMSRPARLRALLCNQVGVALLALAAETDHAHLAVDIYNALASYFLEESPHSYKEKQDLLIRLATLQNTVLQALPLITHFLAQYLPLWNEKDFFAEILALVEWIDVSTAEHANILESLTKAYHRAQPMEQCAILRSLTRMYTNLIFAASRSRNHFLPSRKSNAAIPQMLPQIASRISDMCNKELQTDPEDLRVQYWSLRCSEAMSRAELRHGQPLGAEPGALVLATPLLTPSAILVDKVASLLLLYKKIFAALKSQKERKDEIGLDQRKKRHFLRSYSTDFINYLYHEQILSNPESAMFRRVNPELVKKLSDFVSDAGSMLSLRNGLTFGPYMYDSLDADAELCATSKDKFFSTLVKMRHFFPNLCEFLLTALPELNCSDDVVM